MKVVAEQNGRLIVTEADHASEEDRTPIRITVGLLFELFRRAGVTAATRPVEIDARRVVAGFAAVPVLETTPVQIDGVATTAVVHGGIRYVFTYLDQLDLPEEKFHRA